MDLHEIRLAKDQLMHDIECIIDSHFGEIDYKDDVIIQLCESVNTNFVIEN